jgi:hypothetical protein
MAGTCYARASLSDGLVCLMRHIEMKACLEPWPAYILATAVQHHGTPGDKDCDIYCQAANAARWRAQVIHLTLYLSYYGDAFGGHRGTQQA